MNTTRTISLAAIAGTLALASVAAHAAESPAGSKGRAIGAADMVHCYGLHSCKGQSDCATAEHQCKGHGFKAMKAGECLAKGGVIGDLG